MNNQTLFFDEELTKVTNTAERNHLIECALNQSEIDVWYMEIMEKYGLFR